MNAGDRLLVLIVYVYCTVLNPLLMIAYFLDL